MAARHDLRDRHGRLVGYVEERNCRLEGRDASGRFRGYYERTTDQTRDDSGRLVGTGNLLSSLITTQL